MLDRDGCIYSDIWVTEIGETYLKTRVGRRTPPIRRRHTDPLSEVMTIKDHPVYTPTFIPLGDGAETARNEGYPGQDSFWGLVEKILADLPEDRLPSPAC